MKLIDIIKAIVADQAGLPANAISGASALMQNIPTANDPLAQNCAGLTAEEAEAVFNTVGEHFGIEIPAVTRPKLVSPLDIAFYVSLHTTREDGWPAFLPNIPRAQFINGFAGMRGDLDAAIPYRDAVDAMGRMFDWTEGGRAQFTPHMVACAIQYGASIAAERYRNEPPANIMSGVGERWAESAAASEAGPITRDEVLRRGVDDAGDVTALTLIAKLGWPTTEHPMGTNPTHSLVPIRAAQPMIRDTIGYEIDEMIADARAVGIGVMQDGKRVDPSDFYETPDKYAGETVAVNVGISFVKKPIVIEAVRFLRAEDGVMHFDIATENVPAWLGDALSGAEGQPGSVWNVKDSLLVGTLEGDHIALPGDWIIRGIKGELYPCKPDIFAATYDPFDHMDAAA